MAKTRGEGIKRASAPKPETSRAKPKGKEKKTDKVAKESFGVTKKKAFIKRNTILQEKASVDITNTTPQKNDLLEIKRKLISFCASHHIPVYIFGDPEYEKATATGNLMYRYSRPLCIVQPELPVHIQHIVKEAKARNIPITIRSGGHSYSGSSTADGSSILLDLVKMNKAQLDMKSMTMTLQGGALWGEGYKQLIDGSHDGYMISGGRCPNVGASGFVLGAGLGPFSRSYGMGCDSLMEATIVTADGKLVTVKKSDDPGSEKGLLFWALCGAGGGNFGVVVEMKMEVIKLRSDVVVAGMYVWEPEPDDTNFLSTMNDFYTANWPDQMTIDSSWLCDVQQNNAIRVRFRMYYDGNEHSFQKHINKYIVNNKRLSKQIERHVSPSDSTRFLHASLEAQWKEDGKSSLPTNETYRVFGSFVFENDLSTIQKVTSIIKEELEIFRAKFKGQPVKAQVTMIHSGGQIRNKPATSFPWRDAIYTSYIMLEFEEQWDEKNIRGFLHRFKSRLRKYSMAEHAAFVNFPDGALPSEVHEKAYYGTNREKLRQVKQIWDKDNFFKWQQSVQLPQPKETDMKKASVARASEEQSSDTEYSVDEEALTDVFASHQWKTQTAPPSAAHDWPGKSGHKSSISPADW